MLESNWFLTDIEKAEVARFADNPVMFEAVRKVLLKSVYFQGILAENEPANARTNFALHIVANNSKTNEQSGAELRARWEGVNFVEAGFEDILTFKSPVDTKKKADNPAR